MKRTEITKDQIKSVYSGKDRHCCCGCAGKHYAAAENPRMATKIMNIINAAEQVDNLGSCVSTVIGKRLYVVYFK